MRTTPDRLQRLPPHGAFAWHEHRCGYAAIVLAGGYVEFGEGGWRAAKAGDVVIHAPFSGHANLLGKEGAVIANIPLSHGAALSLASGSVVDPERLVRDAAHDDQALARVVVDPPRPRSWHVADRLAIDLDAGRTFLLRDWAVAQAVSVRHLLRQFRMRYAMSPARYRARGRARRAWRALLQTRVSMTALAHGLGFADLAHMSRAVRALTGEPPSVWRRGSDRG